MADIGEALRRPEVLGSAQSMKRNWCGQPLGDSVVRVPRSAVIIVVPPRPGVHPAWEGSLIPNRSPHPAIAEAGRCLRDFLLRRDLSSFAVGPQQGSPFELEKHQLPPSARAGAGTILAHAEMVCQFRLLAAMDFMSGVASLMSTAGSVYSVFPLSRAAIECAAYVTWILEPDISAQQRAYRGALDHRESTCESINNLQRYSQSGLTEDQSRQITRDIAGFESKLSDIKHDLSRARGSLPSDTNE